MAPNSVSSCQFCNAEAPPSFSILRFVLYKRTFNLKTRLGTEVHVHGYLSSVISADESLVLGRQCIELMKV